jgi:MATE family multidrug resistance protein
MPRDDGSFLSELGICCRLSIPFAGAQLSQVALNFVATIAMGALGPRALAGGALGVLVFSTLVVVCSGVLSAVGALVAQAHGANSPARVTRVTAAGLLVAAVVSIPCVLVMAWPAFVFDLLREPPAVSESACEYLRSIFWSLPAALSFLVLRNFVGALGKPRVATFIMFGGVALAHALNRMMIAGMLGREFAGLHGIGLTIGIAHCAMLATLAAYVFTAAPFRAHRIFSELSHVDARTVAEVLRLGAPVGVMFGLEAGLFTMTGFLMGKLGSTALAAHQIVAQNSYLAFMIPSGIGMAATMRVGQASGANDVDRVRNAVWAALALACFFMAFTSALFLAVPRYVIHFYVDTRGPQNAEVVAMASMLFGIAAIFQIADGVQGVVGGTLRGLRDTRIPLHISVLAYWGIGLTTGFLLAFVGKLGAVGLWFGIGAGLSAAAVLLALRLYRLLAITS